MTAILLLLFLALPVLPARCGSAPRQSFHLELARVDAVVSPNLTDHELLRRAVLRSLDRPGTIARPGAAGTGGSRKAAAAEAPMLPGGGEYLVKLGIGTPQHFFSAAIDTASDLVWMQCQPCVSCYRQLDPVFNPKLSSSFAVVPCSSDTCDQLDDHRCRDEDDDNACQYTYKYSGNAATKGILAMDKLAIGGDVFHGVVFGCSDSSVGGPPPQASGLVGLGRGPVSLVSQLSVRRFMYCLPPPMSKTAGKLVLGADADAVRNVSDRVAVTMSSSPRYPSYYHLNLDGLAVGDRTPLRLNRNATSPTTVGGRADAHGMIVDIASTITFLEASLYEELANDLEQEIRLPRGTASRLGLDLCFILPDGVGMDRVYVPSVSLSFDGRWLELERDRLFVEDRAGRMMCLMIGKTTGVSILGNFQQQNMQVLYNLRRGKITFAKTSCESTTR
ncbi:aspartyl protease 37-like [Phragmites australis]|uniref:aspartyl protease 37-like n=1 Tax=Phragmites australis TaxID=29695 RepID=UPI002D77CEE9|nr:aspartyl protease 37-like [Phragmites australis]